MRLRLLSVLPLLAALLLLPSCAARQGGGGNIAGIAWLAQSGAQDAKGFYLERDGRLLLLGDAEQVGQTWKLTDASLVLTISPDGVQPGKPHIYTAAPGGGRLTLTPQRGGTHAVYLAAGAPGSLRGTRWTPLWVRGAEKVAKPYALGLEPHLRFDDLEPRVDGFAGINKFHGPYERNGDTKVALGPLAATRMSGPGMPWEAKFLEALGQADTMVVTGQRLYLFRETLPLAEFQASGQ